MSAAKKASIIDGVDHIARSLIRNVRNSEREDDPKARLSLDQKLDVFKELSRWVMILHRLDGTADEGSAINEFRSKITPATDSGANGRGSQPRAIRRDEQAATTVRELLANVPGYEGGDREDDTGGSGAGIEGKSSDLSDAAGDQLRLRDQISFGIGNSHRRPPILVDTGRPGGDDTEDDFGGDD